jgi:hypothetical protein
VLDAESVILTVTMPFHRPSAISLGVVAHPAPIATRTRLEG